MPIRVNVIRTELNSPVIFAKAKDEATIDKLKAKIFLSLVFLYIL